MNILKKIINKIHKLFPGQNPAGLGQRTIPENLVKRLYRQMYVDSEFRQTVIDIRKMDAMDPRVKKIHTRTARAAVKGGLRIKTISNNKVIIEKWKKFEQRLQLKRKEKLESDCRGLLMEGNLPMQWVLDKKQMVSAAIRMPSETIVSLVNEKGIFDDPQKAYEQWDLSKGKAIASFALWQLTMIRLTPQNYDDNGCYGRPYLDSSRSVWKKLVMTEEDLVIRRRTRAPLRLAHTLENAKQEELEKYQNATEAVNNNITTDYFLNKKGGVVAIQGDENLSEIADVVYLLDTFFAGAPGPKGLFGYGGDLARDVIEILTKDFFDEIDSLQDTLAFAYETGFRLDLLLAGINPEEYDFSIIFAERRTDSANQRADMALKLQAMSISRESVWEAAGLNSAEEAEKLKIQEKELDPYPFPENISNQKPTVNITPGNAPQGESATNISSS